MTIQPNWLYENVTGRLQVKVLTKDSETAEKLLEDNELNNNEKLIEVPHTIEKPKYKYLYPKCNPNNIETNV